MPVVEPMMAHDAGSHTPLSTGCMKIRLRHPARAQSGACFGNHCKLTDDPD